ncbi:MAG: PQQ-like beta-propeller repeat protein [Planctomycetaceae bacterium]|nr:PQQ-like beta-propeller repeat protein [Planctomycetaceae bacterium]
MKLGIIALLAALSAVSAPTDNWAEFRGPGGDGHSDATGLPREWSETKNVAWKTAIHGRGWSSPVVWSKQIWLTTGTPDGKELSVLCLDKDSGKILLDHKLFEVAKPDELWRKFNSYASPTPVLEEGHVYVHFGTYGTACLDAKAGKVLWARNDMPCNHWRGAGSSPIVWQSLLILTFDGYDFQYLTALDKKTGKTVWRADRKHDFGTNDGDAKKGFSTPLVIDVGGKPQLISSASASTMALDPATGKEIWHVMYKGHSPASKILYGNGLVYFTTGAGGEVLAVKPDGTGDVSATHIAWRAKVGAHKPSPLLHEDLLYVVNDGGAATCFDAKTGQQVWKQRVVGSGYSASPLYADGAIWFFAEDGSAMAIQPGREFKELGKSKLEGGTECKMTPAIVGKAIFLRTTDSLYRIEQK